MENSKSSKSDEGSDDKDDDTTDRKKTPEFEDKVVSKLLRRIGEKSLIPLFSQQRITMEMLMDLSHADLREVGIDIFGQRHKILTEVARLKRERGQRNKGSRCGLHPFNTTCPGRKRKLENQNVMTKKMRLGVRNVHTEVPVVVSTASSIQPHTSVTTTSPSVCQTTPCQSSQTQTSSAISSSSLNVGSTASIAVLATPIPMTAIPATTTAGTPTTAITAVTSATSITASVSTTVSAIQNPATTATSSSTSSLVFSSTVNLLSNTTTTPSHTITTSSVPCVSTSASTGSYVLPVPATSVHCTQNTITDEENNFLRYFLMAQLGTQALRILFDSFVKPMSLTNHLQNVKPKLKHCTVQQIAILYPGARGPVTSADFDTSLLYTLLRNTVKITPPTSGWNKEPNPADISKGDDVERIRFARNSLCHGKTSMDQSTFNSKWTCLSQAIGRLSSGFLNGDVASLATRKFDKSEKQVILDDFLLLKKRLQQLERRHIPFNVREQHEEILNKWGKEYEVLCETRAYYRVKSEIESKDTVTIISGPGMGKTFIARQTCLHLQNEGWEIIPVQHVDEMSRFRLVSIKQVFLLDDPVGVFGFDRSTSTAIERMFEAFAPSDKTKFIFTCRKAVYYECKDMEHSFFRNIIDIGSLDLMLNEKEMKDMLASHCKSTGVEEKVYINISLNPGMTMFPLLCRLFANDKENQKCGRLFFETANKSIINQFKKMRNQKESQYAALVLCMLANNHLTKKDIPEYFGLISDYFDIINQSCIQRSLKELTGTYVVKNNGVYSFLHDALFEAIACLHALKFPEQVLNSMPSSYIANNVRVTSETTESGYENLCICLKRKHYEFLVRRLLKDIKDVHFYDVFDGKSLKCEEFMNFFISYLDTVSTDDLVDLILTVHPSDSKLLQRSGKAMERIEYWGKEYYQQKLLIGEKITISTITGKGKGKYIRNNAGPHYNILALSWMIHYGHTRLLSYILDRLDDRQQLSDIRKSEGVRLLLLACFIGNLVVVKRLVSWLGMLYLNGSPNQKTDDNNEHLCFTPLTGAVFAGHESVIGFLVDEGADVNLQDNTGEEDTPLTKACRLGYTTVVQTLLRCKADINEVSGTMRSPLFWASRMSRTDIVRLLIQNNCDVNIVDSVGRSALHEAAGKGFDDIVKLLVENKADTTLVDRKGKLAITLAKESNKNIKTIFISQCKNTSSFCQKFVQELMQMISATFCRNKTLPNILTDKPFSCLFDVLTLSELDKPLPQDWHFHCFSHYISTGHQSVLRCLLSHGYQIISTNPYLQDALFTASRNGDTEIVKHLVEHGADVNICNVRNVTPLFIASQNGHTEIVKHLVEHGADVNICDVSNVTPLIIASQEGHTEIVKHLVEHSADVNICNDENVKPLYIASGKGHTEIVKHLVEHGADVNICNDENDTPLYMASQEGHTEIVKHLVEHSADVNICNVRNATPLFVASHEGHTEIVKHLVEHSADVNICNVRNATPLFVASNEGHTEIVKHLVEHGADVNICNDKNFTPLNMASHNGHTEIVKHLVEHGADVNICNDKNVTPLFIPSHNGHTEIVKHLVEHGADVNICNLTNITPLFIASHNGHTEIVKHLVEHGADVNICYVRNVTPLFIASHNGHTEIVKHLVEHGADVNICNDKNVTPLFMASQSGHTEVVKHLVEHGADVNICNDENDTPLIIASLKGHTEIVKHLVEHGADVNICNVRNATPLFVASQNGHTEIVKHLVEHGADVNICNDKNVTPLFMASQSGHTEVVKHLVEHGADVNICNDENDTPLIIASLKGHTEIVKHLVEHGADVNICNVRNATPLFVASQNGHTEIVKHLVEHGADVNICNDKNVTPLFMASQSGHTEVVKHLVEHGADVNICNDENDTPLIIASLKGHTEIVKHLVEHGADVNICNVRNATPLFVASQNGHTEIVKHLVEHGADVNICNDENVTPLFMASQSGHTEIVKHLVEHGADVNICHDKNVTPLIITSLFGHTEIVKHLVEHGADVNICSVENVTPLFIASQSGHTEVVKHLVEHGADVNICNDKNVTPLFMASQSGHTEVVKHLVEHGADVNICNDENVKPLFIASQNGHTEIVKHLVEHGAVVNICN
ncbi:uncharacterized protein LOC125659290 [Ostrea edulis]|uniref:uncharacterized protein LOC125659290 n=1 Tax=Ostrea edulis TaxID=37623 RepID=UPI0024AF58EF|nr:uncharacterized protein LOC125659290 [Ostrea edulis]